MIGVLSFLDYASVFVFALTGALAASRAQLDIVGFAFLATLTAVGGGTVRDLLLGRAPVFWVDQPMFVGVAIIAAVIVFWTAHRLESRMNAILWLDSIALSVAVAAGAGIALDLGQPIAVVIMMGVTTGCLGGLMRDVVCNEVPLVLKQGELYATAALAGAGSLAVASGLEIGQLPALGFGVLVTWVLRAGSIVFGWRLPVYKARPPRG